MKYLLVTLLLSLTGLISGGPPLPPTALRLQLEASFDVRSAAGIDTLLVMVDKWPDHVRLGIRLDHTGLSCEACQSELVAGTARDQPGADVVVARDLRWAAIHTVLPVADKRSQQTVLVKVDLSLQARGDFQRSDGDGDPGYYNATATGVIATAGTTFVTADEASTRAMITRTALL